MSNNFRPFEEKYKVVVDCVGETAWVKERKHYNSARAYRHYIETGPRGG